MIVRKQLNPKGNSSFCFALPCYYPYAVQENQTYSYCNIKRLFHKLRLKRWFCLGMRVICLNLHLHETILLHHYWFREPLHLAITTVSMQSNESEKTDALALTKSTFLGLCYMLWSVNIFILLFNYFLFGLPVS